MNRASRSTASHVIASNSPRRIPVSTARRRTSGNSGEEDAAQIASTSRADSRRSRGRADFGRSMSSTGLSTWIHHAFAAFVKTWLIRARSRLIVDPLIVRLPRPGCFARRSFQSFRWCACTMAALTLARSSFSSFSSRAVSTTLPRLCGVTSSLYFLKRAPTVNLAASRRSMKIPRSISDSQPRFHFAASSRVAKRFACFGYPRGAPGLYTTRRHDGRRFVECRGSMSRG